MRRTGLAPDHDTLSRATLCRDGSGRVPPSDHPGDPRMHRGDALQGPGSPGDPLRHGRRDHLRDNRRGRERRFRDAVHQLSGFQDPGRRRLRKRHGSRHMGPGDGQRRCQLHVPGDVRQMVPQKLRRFPGARMQVRAQRPLHPHASRRTQGVRRVHRPGHHVRLGTRLQRP